MEIAQNSSISFVKVCIHSSPNYGFKKSIGYYFCILVDLSADKVTALRA